MALEINSLDFSFPPRNRGADTLPLFEDFSLSLANHSVTAILGPSGAGKTTLLRLMASLVSPDRGTLDFDGKLKTVRSSFVFQEPRLFPWRSILENVALPVEAELGRAEALHRAEELLSLVGLGDSLHARPAELSGGQCQRVSIARAFAYPSPLLFMDEPFQSLDLPLRIQLMDLTLSLLASHPRLAVAVTHDPREAIYLADRVLVLGGRPVHILLDERIDLSRKERAYSSPSSAELEARLFAALS